MISTKLCRPEQVAWTSNIDGRLLHARLFTHPRPVDIICGYQHVYTPSQTQRANRMQWWHKLYSLLSSLPNRNHVVLTGDFNCNLEHRPGYSGPAIHRHRNANSPGTCHPDAAELTRIIVDHDLISLNSWNAQDGPTFCNDLASSRIDHVFCKRFQSDAASKQACFIKDAPFLPTSGPMHIPVICTIPRPFVRYGAKATKGPANYAQKVQCREAWQRGHPAWQTFAERTQHHVAKMSRTPPDQCPMEKFHHAMLTDFHVSFPATRAKPPQKLSKHLIYNKWQHRKLMNTHGASLPSLFHIFRFWHHFTCFKHRDREQKKWHQKAKQNRLWDTLREANEAANRHDAFSLYRIVNLFTPKQIRRRVKLRTTHGHPAGPVETNAILANFITEVWGGEKFYYPVPDTPVGVPFSVHELQQAIEQIPPMKGVAADCCPGLPCTRNCTCVVPLVSSLVVPTCPLCPSVLEKWGPFHDPKT